MDLDEYFRPAVESWKTSPEARRLALLRAEHRLLQQAHANWAEEVAALEARQRRNLQSGCHHSVLVQTRQDLDRATAARDRARQAEQEFLERPELAAVQKAARQALVGQLQLAAVRLLSRPVHEPGGPAPELTAALTGKALAARADRAIKELPPEELL
jgi:hypothetical protein